MLRKRKGYARYLVILTLLAIIAGAGATAAGAEATQEQLFKEVETELMCADTCGMHLPSCDNDTAQEMRGQIREKVAAGFTKQEILQWFIDIYGIEILAYPPRSGFNITAWVIPFISLLGGGLIVYLLLNKWVLDTGGEVSSEQVEDIDLNEYRELLEKEQNKYL